MFHRRTTRALAVAGLAMLVAAPMAAAHVTVNPGEAPKGGFAMLAFRVPNERDAAGTTSLEVNLPEDHPIASVRIKPKPGWTYQVERRQLAEPLESHGREITEVVSRITWTGGVIRPGEVDAFEVSMGALPEDADVLYFPTLQTYEGGEVVRWIDEPVGDEEPERPAPALTLVDAEGEHGGTDDEAEPAAADEQAGQNQLSVANTATQDDVDTANTLGIVGIVVGVLGLGTAVVALVTRRRST